MNTKIYTQRISTNAFADETVWAKTENHIQKFYKANGESVDYYQTKIKTCYNDKSLFIKFLCEDEEILSNFKNYNDPVYNEEAVEVFIAPGNRTRYYEIDLSPRNIVFEALITNDLNGKKFKCYSDWRCNGLRSKILKKSTDFNQSTFGNWEAILEIPFKSLTTEQIIPSKWHINFYRIKRIPEEEYSCWLPTYQEPPNFHIPKYFGEIIFN